MTDVETGPTGHRSTHRPKILSYRSAAAGRPGRPKLPWNAIIAACAAICLGLPVALVWAIFAINLREYGRVFITLVWLTAVTAFVFALAFFLARSIDRRGRRGVLFGTLVGMGVSLALAGACFIGNL